MAPVSPAPAQAAPAGWTTHTVGTLIIAMPSAWKPYPGAPKDQGGWYAGNLRDPDPGVAIILEDRKGADDLIKALGAATPTSLTPGGQAADSYQGRVANNPRLGWLIVFKAPRPDGRTLIVFLSAPSANWPTRLPTLQKIVDSIRFTP